MICPSCKKEINDDSKFCPYCLIPIKVGDIVLPHILESNEVKEVTKIEQKPVNNNDEILKNIEFSKREEPELYIKNNKFNYLIVGIIVSIIVLVLIGFGIYNLVKPSDKKDNDTEVIDEGKLALYKKVMGNWVYPDTGMTYILTDTGKYTYYEDLDGINMCEGKYDVKMGAISSNGVNEVIDNDRNFIYTITLKPKYCNIDGEKLTANLQEEEYALTVILPSRGQAILRNLESNDEYILINK